jgi:hypothetical protein
MQQKGSRKRLVYISNAAYTQSFIMGSSIHQVPEAAEILAALGGSDFVYMTGTNKTGMIVVDGRSASNPNPWIRFQFPKDLPNKAGINRVKITLINDSYTLDFHHHALGENFESVITNQTIFERIGLENLQEVFRSFTGYATSTPVIIFKK